MLDPAEFSSSFLDAYTLFAGQHGDVINVWAVVCELRQEAEIVHGASVLAQAVPALEFRVFAMDQDLGGSFFIRPLIPIDEDEDESTKFGFFGVGGV